MTLDEVWTWMAGSSLDIPDCVKKAVREAADQLYREERLDVNDPEAIFLDHPESNDFEPTRVVEGGCGGQA